MTTVVPEIENFIMHYGIPRRSGRYPWGSGENAYQRNSDFLGMVDDLRRQGMSEAEIAKGFDMTTTRLRALRSIAKNEKRQADVAQALRLKEKGLSNTAIGERMGINESSVRGLLDPSIKENSDILFTTSNMLKDQVDQKGVIDVGVGVENQLGISGTKLKTAIAALEEQGYVTHNVQVDQVGTDKKTTIRVLAPPGTEYKDIVTDLTQIKSIQEYSEDGGRTFKVIQPPTPVSADRVAVRYAEEGGADADGVIYLRRGVDDISLGGARYAQVRIAVEGGRYMKGMAMYKDDMPDGVDLLFNTNKSNTGNKLDAMKKITDDEDNPFGSIVRQRHYIGRDGKEHLSAINVVGTDGRANEEGNWNEWSRNLSSQVLSKQSPALAKQQLDIAYSAKKAEYDEIMSLTNPVVRAHLLQKFSDGADASAVHLKAAALPRQRTQVILPINSLKDNEIYAPNFRDGEKVALVRYPHGGKFEIPELTVNNRNKEARASLSDDVRGHAKDAVGINSRVAGRLSGADFDGDTVLVIPNNSKNIRSEPPLEKLKGFDPQKSYPAYEGMKPMSPKTKQQKMGDVSNLITDMTIRGASNAELARAVRHSMVVIDAEKHKLNWQQSAKDHGIAELKKKYQGGSRAGASTLISKASSDIRVPLRKPRPAKDGGPIDKATGKRVFVETGESYIDSKGRTVVKKFKSKKMTETEDAHTLSSGTPMEKVYADHANRLKSLANTARKSMVDTVPTPYSPSAKKAYAKEVSSLNAKLNVALKNAPLERQAQLLANAIVSTKRKAQPDMDNSELKKVKGLALTEARARTGAGKTRIRIEKPEWDAIQAGAISKSQLEKILDNTDLDLIKQYATPRSTSSVSPTIVSRARSMQASGHTQAEIAEALGVSTSTLHEALVGGE